LRTIRNRQYAKRRGEARRPYLVEQWIASGTQRKPFFIEDAADGLKIQQRLSEEAAR
jgi:hypothetical protein